jgi:hypothetical protein
VPQEEQELDFQEISNSTTSLAKENIRQFFKNPLNKIIGGLLLFILLAIGFYLQQPLIAIALLALVVLAGLQHFSSHALIDFYSYYGLSRNMFVSRKEELLPMTPLLQAGEQRKTLINLKGQFTSELRGEISVYSYKTEQGKEKKFTVASIELPKSTTSFPQLIIHLDPNIAEKYGSSYHNDFKEKRVTYSKVEFESQRMNQLYDVWLSSRCDHNALRRLFSPSFLIWLTEEIPIQVNFELNSGFLSIFVEPAITDAHQLDYLITVSSKIANQIKANQ